MKNWMLKKFVNKAKHGLVLLSGLVLMFSATTAQAGLIQLDIVASVDGDIHALGVVNTTFTVNDTNPSIQMSMSGGGSIKRGFFEFDLSTVPENVTILSASFLLMTSGIISNTGPDADLYLYSYLGDGLITLSDWNEPTTFIGSANYPVGVNGTPQHTVLYNELNNLESLSNALSSGDQYFGIQARVPSFVTLNVHSLESVYSNAVYPTLRINVVPIPSAILLLGTGMIVLLGVRKKFKK